jgi:putative tryptophan/tyrosine transport system substrate-binding protein
LAVVYAARPAHIDEVLKGAKSANLPLEEAVSFELVINNRTARALGFTIPESLRQQADQ